MNTDPISKPLSSNSTKKTDKDDIKALIQQMDKKSDEHRADIQTLIQQIDKNASEHREQIG